MLQSIRYILVVMVLLSTVSTAYSGEVRLSVAASLTEAVKALVADYRQTHPEAELFPNFASSGALAKQIVAGAPADIYISANPKWMDYVQRQGLIADGAEQVLVHNSLVFIGQSRSDVAGLQDLPSLQRIALASPKSAPAGKYAEQALRAAEVYQPLVAKHKLILTKDVRQALLYADRGEVDGAFVYRTDALLAARAGVLFAVPQDLYSHVIYPAALTRAGEKNVSAQAFLTYMLGDEARGIFKRYGFVTR